MWIFGADNAWNELNDGGDIKIPRLFYYLMKFITPAVLFIIMLWWFIQDAIPILMLKNVEEANYPYIWGARIMMLVLLLLIFLMIKVAWDKKSRQKF